MPTMITGYQTRPYAGETDLQPIRELLTLCDDTDQLDENHDLDDLRRWLTDPARDQARDIRLWADSAGQLAGVGVLWVPPSGEFVDGDLYFRVHPQARGQGLESTILAWAGAQLRALGRERAQPVKFYTDARESQTAVRALLEQEGFTPVRYFYKMALPLDQPIPEPQFPPGYTLRHVADDADLERWVEMFNLSFIDHWGFHPLTVERRRHRISDPNYRPERDLIAVAPDGTFAAFCYCRIDPADNARYGRSEGWIGVLGTRRGHRQIGLGRAMLLAGMRLLKAEGMATAVLGVDAENPTGALRLYESVGFYKAETGIAYCKDL